MALVLVPVVTDPDAKELLIVPALPPTNPPMDCVEAPEDTVVDELLFEINP